MKIKNLSNNINKYRIPDCLKKIFNFKFKLRTISKDCFEKVTNNNITTASSRKIISRGVPNSVGTEADVYSGKAGKICFYKEDLLKMKSMSENEAKDFQNQLIIDGKYTIDYNLMKTHE